MIAPSVVNEIKRLLAEGSYSQRKIARMMGVSRGTVGAIASGKRREYPSTPHSEEAALGQPAGPAQRCPGCGGLVYMPCRLCHVRKLIAQRRIRPRPARPPEPLRLELGEQQQARYQQVRRRRIEQEGLRPEDKPGDGKRQKPAAGLAPGSSPS